MCVRGSCCVEHNGVRFVANGVAGNIEAMLGGQAHIVFNLLWRVAQGAIRRRLDARIRRGTVGRAGVERTVRDELHGAYMAKPGTARQFLAGMPPCIDGDL